MASRCSFPRNRPAAASRPSTPVFAMKPGMLAQRFLDIFEPLVRSGRVDAVVAPSGSCTTMVNHFYPVLFEDDTDSAEYRACPVPGRGHLRTDRVSGRRAGRDRRRRSLRRQADLPRLLPSAARTGGRSSSRVRCSTTSTAPSWSTLAGDDECCGFGGLFAIKNAPISTAMGERKVDNIAESGADVVTLCDVSCMTHINGLLSRQGHALPRRPHRRGAQQPGRCRWPTHRPR